MRAKVFKFCIHLESGQIYCGTENQDAEINFCLLFPFSISHSNVIHREICVKDFAGTTAPRILKFGTNIGYDLWHCVKANQSPDAYRFLYLSIFLSLHSKFLLQFFRHRLEPASSNFLFTLRVAKPSILWDRKPRCRDLFLPSFPFFHLSLQCNT